MLAFTMRTTVLSTLLPLASGFASVVPMPSCEQPETKEPPLPGIMPGKSAAKVLLGFDIWAPMVEVDPADSSKLSGFGPEFVYLMNDMCPTLDIHLVHDAWDRMWSDTFDAAADATVSRLGEGTAQGYYHAGATYTHIKGTRNRMGEFGWAITKPSDQPVGVITRLESGRPVISSSESLGGQRVVDVAGYAPTEDTIDDVFNHCASPPTPLATADEPVEWVPAGAIGNFAAMAALKEKRADAMYVYADQAQNCIASCANGFSACTDTECRNWDGLGEEYAYIHTGLKTNFNGTTIAFSKKGSGIHDVINPCIQKVMETEQYFHLCKKFNHLAGCYANQFFEGGTADTKVWDNNHKERTDSYTCADGYCTCAEA
jgi:hypothetical protein